MRNSFFNCRILTAILLIVAGLLFAAPPATQSTDAAAKAINALGIDLLRMASTPDANVLLSPYSIQCALAMTYAGADGKTRDEMARVLHFPKDEMELHRSFATLRKELDELAQMSAKDSQGMKKYGATNDPFTLTVANRLFGQAGYEFRSPFLSLLKENYDAPFEQMDFAHQARDATKLINDWVEAQTRQRIRGLIPDGALNELTQLVLVNAIYLKAPWAEPFEVSATKPRPFYLANAKSVEVPTMIHQHHFGFSKRAGYTVVALRYSTRTLQFLILIPDKPNGLPALEMQMSPQMLSGCANLDSREMILSLPKFKLEPPLLPLSTKLKALGMRSAFDEPTGSANFDLMSPRRPGDYLYISAVFHKTFLSLDEKGTEAAAATAVMMTRGIHEPVKPIEVKVDRPFLFAIQETRSGACLFLGRVMYPRLD